MAKAEHWEHVTTIDGADFARIPKLDLFIWRRARTLPSGEVEMRYAWDGDGVVRDSLLSTLIAANGAGTYADDGR